MKESEAKILIYINEVHPSNTFAQQISYKLKLEYSYTVKLLGRMMKDGLIKKVIRGQKHFYHLTLKGQWNLRKAKTRLGR